MGWNGPAWKRTRLRIGEPPLDRAVQEKLRTLDSIEAHLTQHDQTVRRGLIWLSALGIMVLALLVYVITRL
jgi:cell division septal protein FtsQ